MNNEAPFCSNAGTTPLVDVGSMSAFVAVVTAASFTGAARKLGTSKSVISRRISDMELQLGARLIDRSAARVSPTEVGAVYYAKCVRILESIEAANDFVAGFNGSIRGSLRISIPRFFCTRVAAPLIAEFAGSYPDLKIDLEVAEQEADLHDTGFDIALRIGQLPDSSMVARTISFTSVWLCASSEYLRAHGTPQSPEELDRHECLMYVGSEPVSGWVLQRDGQVRMYRVRERLRSTCFFQLLESAKSGLGIALLPAYLIVDAVEAGELEVVMPDFAPRPNPISVVYPSSRRTSQKVQALANYFAERIPDSPEWERWTRLPLTLEKP